jgi:hypothetical protein
MVVGFKAQANFCYCPSSLKKTMLAIKVVKIGSKIIISLPFENRKNRLRLPMLSNMQMQPVSISKFKQYFI